MWECLDVYILHVLFFNSSGNHIILVIAVLNVFAILLKRFLFLNVVESCVNKYIGYLAYFKWKYLEVTKLTTFNVITSF